MEEPNGDAAQTPLPSQPKRPSQALYVPKPRPQASKDGAEARPRPKYMDKARKNARNKKKAGQKTEEAAAPAEGGDASPGEEVDRLQQPENIGASDITGAEDTSQVEGASRTGEENGEEESWDSMFDDDGECTTREMMEELSLSGRKKKSIQEARFDYYNMDKYEDDDDDDEVDLREDELSHILEIYDFPSEFKMEDLLKSFQNVQRGGFDIKWVDDSHALGLFSSAQEAREALRSNPPMMKLRLLSKSSSEIKAKARSCSDYLLPHKERPKTSAALARRLVTNALGVKTTVTKEQRDLEKRKLQEARDQKRLAAQQREDAWEGK